jgi:HK97 family phage portal protein
VAGYLSTEAYGADVFGSGVPQGVLTTPQDITPATGERYRDEWMNGARNPVRVLGNGLTFNAFKLSPKDAAWIEARRFDSEEVARLYGVPAYKLNLQQSGGIVYSKASVMDRDFLRSCVAGGYLKPVERALNALTPAGRNASEELAITFDYSSFLEPTTAELFDTYAVAITNGILTVNEVRERLKLAPLPEPDPEPAAPPAITEAPAAIPPAAESAAAGSVPADDNADDTPTEAAE